MPANPPPSFGLIANHLDCKTELAPLESYHSPQICIEHQFNASYVPHNGKSVPLYAFIIRFSLCFVAISHHSPNGCIHFAGKEFSTESYVFVLMAKTIFATIFALRFPKISFIHLPNALKLALWIVSEYSSCIDSAWIRKDKKIENLKICFFPCSTVRFLKLISIFADYSMERIYGENWGERTKPVKPTGSKGIYRIISEQKTSVRITFWSLAAH